MAHQVADDIGNRELGFDVALVFIEKINEESVQAVEEFRGETPEVHGNGFVAAQGGSSGSGQRVPKPVGSGTVFGKISQGS